MSTYLVTRDGQELGSFEATQIQEGLKTGHFQATDWGWREGMSGWQGLTELFDTTTAPQAAITSAPQAKAIASPTSAPVRQPIGPKKAESLNPYASPTANTQPAAVTGTVPQAIVNELAGTKPWVRFISVLMWIGSSIFLLFTVINLIVGLIGGGAMIKSGSAGAGVAFILISTLVYGIMALLIVYPTLKLSKYASNIGLLSESRSFADLAAALAEQRRFWKFYGILIIIYMSFAALFVLLILAGVGLGGMAR